ncbi:hypothetical protein [Lactiplantibacillus mudanjiangensis]|uniref:Uncharacterized protein n=1 Tax=Lactiplantibacillus mudanjiangensis TaxID=1296538 RepID=A0A660E091_9LACO|nr:hypothetical protein [Lactiplantibacillus mudanjiangensis]VDG25823.1 Hypothetical protein [Lactobacillus plantarum ZJ316] [Lactiplantibacillus mudanjiangensis]VDG28896.1 Hypothetical protein [Lactobacillus plantarum ZJ316] [Lactiplantibacillus mudanjiangensis]
MKNTYEYEDGFGTELTMKASNANILMSARDIVSGDVVVTQLSLSEVDRLVEFLQSATQHVKDD